jgi:glycosyltransferase involved in cell wall biosynthesis
MRSGQNPAKFLEEQASEAERITVAILTHIPYLHGYYAESLEVLKASLGSLREHTELPYDLLVFDTASGLETTGFLQTLYETGHIDYLIFSKENIGKGKAWDFIFNAAPGEIIAYADNDVAYKPGWLSSAITLLETFPKVGMVTCRPMRTYLEGYSASLTWAEQEPDVLQESGDFIDWETFREHDLGLGQDEEQVRARYENTKDIRVQYRGAKAMLGAAHWQFVAYTKVLQSFLPLGIDRPLGDDRKLDDALNKAGYLRLMTTEPFVKHLGNTLPADLKINGAMRPSDGGEGHPLDKRLLDWPPIRRVLLGIYNRIFRLYFYR